MSTLVGAALRDGVNTVLDLVVVVVSYWPVVFDADEWLETYAFFRALEAQVREFG